MNTDISHLEHRLVPDPKTGCLVWPGGKSDKGYAMAVVNGKRVRVHRAVYEKYCGPIPKGLVIDHLCNNKACCNMDHLRVCTDKVNILRGNGVAARNNRKTHCPKGHPYSGDNLRTRVHKGCVERLCKACISMQNRARRMVGLPIPDPSA